MENKTEKLINLAKKRGFINQSSEIYVLLKNKIKELWLNDMIKSKLNILPIDSAIIMSPKV
jgi:glycyl-tRNA synthetase (class II)